MEAKLLRWWLRQLGELSVRQVEQLKGRLAGSEARNDARDWINRRAEESLTCPHCQVAHVQRWGRESGIQRYRCCDGHRTFNALTGSPLAGLKCREAWADYAKAMIDCCRTPKCGPPLGRSFEHGVSLVAPTASSGLSVTGT